MEPDETTCPECAETVKAAAKVCKHCGYRFDGADPSAGPEVAVVEGVSEASEADLDRRMLQGFGILALAIVAVGSVYLSYTGLTSFRPSTEAADQVALKGQRAIVADFLDPSSATFRKLWSNDRCLTGEVNGKNSYGAYTGFKSFYFDTILNKGRVDPGLPDDGIALTSSKNFSRGLDDYSAYVRETSVCIVGEDETAKNEAQAAKALAARGAKSEAP